ncbi:MAG TPA: hypothetical protein VK826_02950 [Bacteroidia bacterium]|nr:hypothetical protein [Bacteroidia bacterium]
MICFRHIFIATLVLLLQAELLYAQVPYQTQIDTVAINKHKRAKEKCVYIVEQKYDSVTGKIPSSASFDTIIYTRYDKLGRETEFCYYDEDGTSNHTWLFYDKFGRVVRQLSANADSTDGFEERWYYGDGYQVVREDRFTRTGSKSELYHYTTFTYNLRGQLTSQWEYYVDGDSPEPRPDHFIAFTYNPAGMEILQVTRNGSGDTVYVDSTFYLGNTETYYENRYALIKDEQNGKATRVRRSYYAVSCDTANGVITNTYDQRFYDYRTGTERSRGCDTLISNLAGNVVETRGERYVEKISFNEKNEYLYTIRYNRAGQPITRRTAYTTYY